MLNDDLRPRRSVLYMPGANERALEKAKTIPADALILDLEDAVAPDAKADARARVCAAAASGDYGRKEVTIRANGLDTPWHADDLRAIAEAGPAAVVVPKINSAADVAAVEKALEAGGAPDHTRIWAMLETPVAVLNRTRTSATPSCADAWCKVRRRERFEASALGSRTVCLSLASRSPAARVSSNSRPGTMRRWYGASWMLGATSSPS